jgi:hypothetical protein
MRHDRRARTRRLSSFSRQEASNLGNPAADSYDPVTVLPPKLKPATTPTVSDAADAALLQPTLQLPVNEPDPNYTRAILAPVFYALIGLHLLISKGLNCWVQ